MARSRFHRSPDALPPLRWTPRDSAILRTVLRCRCCLVEHLQTLHFPSYKTAAERSMKLFHHRYLDRLPLNQPDGGQPAMVHVLGEPGLDRLRADGVEGVPEAPLDRDDLGDMSHAVRVADAVVSFQALDQHPGIEVPIATAHPAVTWSITPDAAMVVDVPARLFRRILLLDVSAGPTSVAARAWGERFEGWRRWVQRARQTVEADLAGLLETAPASSRSARARVSIGVVAADEDDCGRLAALADARGASPLIHLTTPAALAANGVGGAAWVQAAARHRDGSEARRTSVLS